MLTLTSYGTVVMEWLLDVVHDSNGRALGGNSHFQNVGLKAMARADTAAFVSYGSCSRWDSELTIDRSL